MAGLKVVVMTLAYLALSIGMLSINKALVNAAAIKSGLYAVNLVLMQNLIGVVILATGRVLTRRAHPSLRVNVRLFDKSTLGDKRMIVVTFMYTVSILMDKLLLRHISISSYRVAKSPNMLFDILLGRIFLEREILFNNWITCALTACGFYLRFAEKDTPNEDNLTSIVLGIASGLFASIYCLLFKRINTRISSLQFAYNELFLSSFLLAAVVLWHWTSYNLPLNPIFWFYLILSGGFSFCLRWVINLLMSLTTPVTYRVITNVKFLLQTIVPVCWYNESHGNSWWLSNLLVLCGVVIHFW